MFFCMLSSIDKSSLPWRKSSTKYVFISFLKLFKFTFGQRNDLILWKSVFLNSSYLSQLNKRSCGKYIQTLLLRNHFKIYNQIVYVIILWAFIYNCGLNWKCKKYLIMEHDLAKDPASPKLLGIWKNYMMYELSFSAHHFRLVRAIWKKAHKTFHHY